jgi:hypothetical protein
MKLSMIAISAALFLTATSAFAAGTSVTNNSGLPIDELFAAAPGTTTWGANLMEGIAEGMLDNGKTSDVAALADGTYDLRGSAPDEGILCIIPNVTVKTCK